MSERCPKHPDTPMVGDGTDVWCPEYDRAWERKMLLAIRRANTRRVCPKCGHEWYGEDEQEAKERMETMLDKDDVVDATKCRRSIWEQFVESKKEWIGGTLTDFGDGDPFVDQSFYPDKTEIMDIELTNNETFFRVVGKEWGCGFNVEYGGIYDSPAVPDTIRFQGYGGHVWQITKPDKDVEP
ncbi:MAG: hypothetical protein ABIJ53_02700 [Verrucomicrobiota bacterium]